MRLAKRTTEQKEALKKIDTTLEALTSADFIKAAELMKKDGQELEGSPKQIKWAKDIVAASALSEEQKEVVLLGRAGTIIEHRNSAFLLLDYTRQLAAKALGLLSSEDYKAAEPTRPALPKPGTLGFIC